jgi:hypothetical protein
VRVRHPVTTALAVPAAALALAAVPAFAAAASPPTVSNPSPASVRAGLPAFAWTNGPAGEYVSSIDVGTSPATAANGALLRFTRGGAAIYNIPPTRTSATVGERLTAGRYYWNAGWTDPATGSFQYLPVRSFVVPARILNVRIRKIEQPRGSLNILFTGTTASNTSEFRLECRITNGRRTVSRQVQIARAMKSSAANPIGCQRLTVPQRLLGERLTLTVSVSAMGQRAVASRSFTPRR